MDSRIGEHPRMEGVREWACIRSDSTHRIIMVVDLVGSALQWITLAVGAGWI